MSCLLGSTIYIFLWRWTFSLLNRCELHLDTILSSTNLLCNELLLRNSADWCRVLSRLIDHVWSLACVEKVMFYEKEPTLKQPGINRFFSKSQRTDGNEEAHKTAGWAGRQVQAITASSSAGTSAACGQPVELSIIIDLCKLRCMNLKLCTVKNKQY